MKLRNVPLEAHIVVVKHMDKIEKIINGRLQTRLDKFQHGPNEKTDQETKDKIISEITKCFDEIFDAITTN